MIESLEIKLEPISFKHSDFLIYLYSQPEVMNIRKTGGLDNLQTMNLIKERISHFVYLNYGMFVISLKENNTLIGECGLLPTSSNNIFEPSIGIISTYQNQGYGKSALKLVALLAKQSPFINKIIAHYLNMKNEPCNTTENGLKVLKWSLELAN